MISELNRRWINVGFRFLAVCLTVNLSLPSSAFALKPTETKESAGLEELDRTLRNFSSGDPSAVRTAGARLAQAIGLDVGVHPPSSRSNQVPPVGVYLPGQPTSGLEEGPKDAIDALIGEVFGPTGEWTVALKGDRQSGEITHLEGRYRLKLTWAGKRTQGGEIEAHVGLRFERIRREQFTRKEKAHLGKYAFRLFQPDLPLTLDKFSPLALEPAYKVPGGYVEYESMGEAPLGATCWVEAHTVPGETYASRDFVVGLDPEQATGSAINLVLQVTPPSPIIPASFTVVKQPVAALPAPAAERPAHWKALEEYLVSFEGGDVVWTKDLVARFPAFSERAVGEHLRRNGWGEGRRWDDLSPAKGTRFYKEADLGRRPPGGSSAAGLEETNPLLLQFPESMRPWITDLIFPVFTGLDFATGAALPEEEHRTRRKALLEELRKVPCSSAALSALDSMVAGAETELDLNMRLLRWITVHVLLPHGVAPIQTKRGFRLFGVVGYELFQLSGKETPVPVIYLMREMANKLAGHEAQGWHYAAMAFVVIHPDISHMEYAREEELIHAWDNLKFKTVVSTPADFDELTATFQLSPGGRLLEGLKTWALFALASEGGGVGVGILLEVRQLLRRLSGPGAQEVLEREELRTDDVPWGVTQRGFLSAGSLAVGLVRMLLLEQGYGVGTSMDTLREMAKTIWVAEFDASDPIEISADRVFPASDEETTEQLILLSRVAHRELSSTAGLEEISLPAQISGNSLVVLTPATADALGGLAWLGRGGAPLQIGVIVADDAQEARARAGLEEAGGALALRGIINLSDTGQTLGEAIVTFQVKAWAEAIEVFVVEKFEQLRGLGRFLNIPDISFRSWLNGVQRRLEQAA